MHSARPVVDIIANPSADQIITCGIGKSSLQSVFRFYILIIQI
jgi:hypothetical protein